MLTKLATFLSAAVIFLCFFVTVLEYFTRELYCSVQRRVNNITSIVNINVQPTNTASVADTCEKKLTNTTRSINSKSESTAGVAISNKPTNSVDIVSNEEPTAMNKMTSLEISRANSLLHRQPKNPLQKMKNGRPCSFPTTRTELYSIYRNQGERQTEEQRILDEIFSCLLKGIVDGCYDENGLNALHLSSKEGHLNIVTELLKRGADVDAATKKGNTALHIASLAGQEDIVRVLVEFNANVNVQSQNGFTPLYMAAQENHVKVVKFLLANGANQNLATEDGFLPLDVATQQGHDIVVETLLQHSRPQYPNKSEDGFTPLAVALQQGHDKVVAVLLENDRAGKTRLPALHIAARKDDTKAASLLLQNGHNPDVPSKSQFTPLHIAAHYGHVNVATLLLQKGASVDYNARNHIKPLHVAAKWGRVNMVNTLLDRGACIDAKTRDGLTPLHCSARSGHEQCVDQLLERGAPISAKTKNGLAPLHMAAQGDHVDSARLLLYHHAPVDDVTVDYLTPLHVAAHCGHHKVAKLLLDRKANPSARALNGFTPLHIACKKNRVKVIELLLKYGASVQAITESGLTPLHVAAFMGNINIVMYLIKNGGGVDETNVRGETPLHLAARANQIEVIRVLLSNGAKVDARAHENQTPLHIAARLGNAEIVKLLLDNGASPDAQTRDLYTALHIAAREGKEDVARVLLDNGATLSMTTKKDFTPLHVAAKYGRYDVAQLLLSRYASPDATAQNGLTPLHIAAHYDNVKVAMLLLDQGASPHKTAKNGFTPLHIAAKKNQMDVATTLLEYGADSNAMTKQGISPIHLAAQEGHTEMLALLLERGAKPNIMSKNGLTPLHLAAQEDQLEAVAMLLDNGSQIDPQTKAGYTPLHVACHYGNLKTVTYLLEHGSAVQAKTKHGLTPLHQGAQQGHVAIINILLQHKAEPNETANNGYTALGIAKRFGYISVVNTLSIVTTETSTVISPTEEKLKVQVPETMQVTFMSDTEDEESTGDDVSMTGDQSLLTPQEIRTMGDDSVVNDHRRSWEEDWMRGEPIMNYYTGHESLSGHYGNDKGRPAYSPTGYSTMDSRNSTLNRDYNAPLGRPDESLIEGEMITATTQSTVESAPPLLSSTPNRLSTGPVITLNGKTYNIGDPYVDDNGRLIPGKAFGPNGRPVSVTLDNAPINQMPFFAGFLISFIVDARGGTMRSCRLPGLRVVVPPQRASGPTRVTCRLIKRTKLTTQPPLMENESLASRVLEVGPANTQFLGGLGNKSVTYPPLNDGEALCSRIIEMGPPSEKFLRPVLIEVPHFASLRGNEREIVILRSETGETWKEHSLDASDEEIQKSMEGYDVEDNDQSKGQTDRRMCRILTKDFPQYFAIISRVRQETNTIGPSGGMLNSTVVPQVQAVFPEGTLTKKIKVGLQAQPVGNDVVKKVLGNRVMVSPIVTIEPRRRKFHKPITVTIPVPTAYNQGVINGYGGDFPTLRLLCSITGGTAPAQWEDITGTTPLTFVNDCVSFTTTVSARFWLMDCKEIDQASNFARELYQELKAVPFMAKFVVYAKTHDPIEGRVRVFCVTDDKSEKSLEQQENFKEVARSKFVEVLESRPVYIEMAGNLVPVQKSGDQLNLAFTAFHENRLPFFVRVRDQSSERCGRLSFMREPKVPRGLPPQKAACNLNVTMPSYVKVKKASESESESESSSEDEEYKMEKGEQKEQKMFTKKELYSLTSIEEYQDGSKEQDGVPSNINFASIKLRKKYTFLQDPSMSPKSAHQRAEIRLWDVANQVGDQWQDLGRELGLNERELKAIERENDDRPEQAFVMLHNWAEQEGKDATSEKLEEALRSIGRGDIIDRCLGKYVSLDVSAQPDDDSDMMRDIQMALDQSDRLGNDLDAFSPQGQADITLEFSGGQQTPDILQSTLEEQARQEVTDRLIKELKEEAIEASSSEDVQESAAVAEFYEEIKEEILEKHEEERRELHFEPSFGTLEETKEEDSPSPTGPQDVRDSARPTDLGEPGKPTEHQEKTRVETTRSETVTTVRTIEQKIITGEITKMEIKEDFPEKPPKESKEYKEEVLDHEMPPKSKELEPVETFESKVKDVERLQESGAVEQTEAQVVQDIPVKEVEKERVENREVVVEYDVKSEVKESEKPTETGQPCEEPAMEDQEVNDIVMVHDSRVSQDVNIQGEYQAGPLERLVQSPEPVPSPDAEQKEVYEYEQQKEVTDVRETTKVEEKTVNVVEIKEERHIALEPEVSESVAEQPEYPMQTKNLQGFDKPTEILAAEKEDDETVKEESKAMATKELSDEPVIEMDKVEEVKEEVEEASHSPKRENETVTHYQETVTTVVTTTEIRGREEQEVDGGIFSRPTALEDKEESGEIPGEQVREYVSNVVDSAIIQEQSRTELVDEENKKPSVDSDNLKEVSPFEDSQESTTVLEKEPNEVVKETIQVKEKEQVVFDEPQEEQAPILASEPIKDTPEDVPKENDEPLLDQKTEVVVKETVQVIEKEQVVFEDEPQEEQAPTLASEPIQAPPEDVPKGDDQPHIEQKTEEVVVKETVQVIEKEQVVFEDEPQKEQAPTLASEPIQAPEDVPKGDDQPHIEQKTEEVVIKETVQVIKKEQVVFGDEPEEEQSPTPTSKPFQDTPEDVPKENDQPISEQKTEDVVVKETVQVIEKEQVIFEDEPQGDQTPTVISEHIRDTLEDIPKEEEQSIRTTFIEQKTEEVVVKETVQVIEKEQVVFEDEPQADQTPTVTSENIHDTPEDVPEEEEQPIGTTFIEQKTEEVVVKETVQVIEKEQVIFEDEPQADQTPTVSSEHIHDTPEDVHEDEEQSIRTTFIEQKTEEVVVKETVQVIEKEQVAFEDESQADQTPTVTSEHIHDTPENAPKDVPKEYDQSICATFIEKRTEEVVVKETTQVIEKEKVVFEDEPQKEQPATFTSETIQAASEDAPKEDDQPLIKQKTEEVVVKDTVQVIEKEQVVFEDEPQKEQAPTLTSEPIQAPPEDVPKGDDQPHIEQKTEEVVIKETVQVIKKEQVVFKDEPEEEQSPTPISETFQDTPEDVPKENDQPITEQKTENVVVKETVQVIEKEQVIFEDEPREDQTPTVTSEHISDTSEDIPKEEEQSIRTTFIEQKTEEVVVKETVQVIEKEQVAFEDESQADQTPTVTSEHIHDTPENAPKDVPKEYDQSICATFIEKRTEEVVVKETTQVIEKEEVTFEDETKEEQAQTVTSEHIQDATYNVQEDVPKVPVEEPTVEDSESGQDMTLHREDEFTTQNLEFLGAPEYDEEDISTSMEVMPSERENVDGDDDFLEDIQEEPEGDEMERTDIAPSQTTYIYEERTQQVLISNEQVESSAVTTESHEEIISEERIGEKSSTTEFSHTVLQEEIHLLPGDAPVHLEHDAKPQNEEKRDIIHENIEEIGVTAVHSEINFHTKPIMDQTKVDEEKLVKVPDDREIIVQEPLRDEPEVSVEARDSEPFTEATPQDQVSEISITEERIGEKVVTSTFKETVLHQEIHNIVEESPAVTDESEPPKEEVKGTVCETVHQTTVTSTHTEIVSTLPVTEKYLEEMSGEEQHTPEEEQTQPTNAEREDLSPRDEGMTSEDIEELQEDQQGQIRENGSFSHETTTEETRSIVTTREVRFVEDIKVDASEPEDETHLGEEPDMTEHDISIDEDQSDDSDMIPEIKLDLQSDEIVQDDDVLAERRARDHGYLIEPDPPTEESEIILGEDEIFEEQLGVDDEDLDTKTDSISYMEEQVDETTFSKEDQQLAESVPVDYDIQPSDIPHVEDKSERRPEYKEEEADITTSYKTIEESMIIQGEVYLESEPKEEQKPDGGEMAPVEQELDTLREDGRSTPDILDITGEYATSYAHVEMSQQSYQVDEPMAPLDVTQEAGEGETPRYTEEMDVSTGDSKEGAALVATEQQYLVDTPVSETSTHEQWVETQVGDATVRTRETHKEETYTDETEDGQTVYTRHVVTETRVITSGGPLLEGMIHPAEYPEELIIQPQPPSPDSLLTPEIQELPDTPESSTHEGSTEPTDNQGFCFETMDVTQSTSESSQFVVDDVLDHQVQQEEEQQEAPLLDGPTESDYYDPSLIGVPQQQEYDYELEEPEPEIIDSPQDVELPEGEDISSQQYSDFTLQQEVSASLSHQDQSLGDVPHSETVVQESHVEFLVHSEEQSVPDNETFDVAEEDRADSIVSPRPPEPVSEVEAQLPPIDVSVLESSPAPEPETEKLDEGAVGDEVDSPTKPYKGQIPIPTSPKSEGSEEPPKSPQGSVDDQSDHVVTHEEYETKQEDGGVVKKSVHVTRTTFRREVSFPGAAVQSGQAILQTRSVSEFHAGPDQTHLRSREEMEESTPQITEPLVDEQLDAPMVLGEKEEKPAFTPEELEDFAQALNDFAINDLPEDDQESPAAPSDQAVVQEDMSATESAPPAVETNLKTLDEMTPEEEKEMEDLLNMDFTKAYQQPTEEGQAPRSSEPEEVSPSTPASPTTPHVDLMPDDTDLLAAANQLQKEMEEEEEPEVGGASVAEAGDEEREPKTPEITDFLEGQFSFLPDEPLGVVETEPNIEFPPEMEIPVDGDEDVEEEIEEYEETLDDGTIRKVIKRRIKKRTVQMIPVEIDPSDYPEGAFGDDDDVRRITVHKKVTRKTFMRDGEEVDQQEEVETNIEEDGVVKENSELREDLQQIVDGLLKDQSIEGESTMTVVVSEETHEGEESEI
ncbi:ankyrin-2-like isoform X41 [Lytechinus pictus]|uniref:ankyrin-2-like isoform X41 n=1 Tax=Lytechinus pictus TaxID=7653 RepID=UPI0030B9D2B5